MKRVFLTFTEPEKDEYFGGIAFIADQYVKNSADFSSENIDVSILDLGKYNSPRKEDGSTKIWNFRNMFKQAKGIIHDFKSEKVIVHIQTSRYWMFLKDMYLAKQIKKNTDNQVFLTIHFAEMDKILYSIPVLRNWEINALKNYFDGIIFLSERTKNEAIKLGVPEKKSHVLYTFHSFDLPKDVVKKKSKKLEILFMGSIDRRKGILDLLNATVQLTDVDYRLHICGQISAPNIADEYHDIVGRLGDKVVEHGYVSGVEKEKIFSDADLFVLPSYAEGMPIVLFEAMAAGCAIITTDVGAIPEIITEKNGEIVSPGDVSAISRAIESFATNSDRLQNIKEYNYNYSKEYNVHANINKLCALYNSGESV